MKEITKVKNIENKITLKKIAWNVVQFSSKIEAIYIYIFALCFGS